MHVEQNISVSVLQVVYCYSDAIAYHCIIIISLFPYEFVILLFKASAKDSSEFLFNAVSHMHEDLLQ